MKKYIALLLALALCTTLCGCIDLSRFLSDSDDDTPVIPIDYSKYDDLFDMLEDGDYDAARAYIDELEGRNPAEDAYPVETISPMEETEPAAEEEVPAEPTVSTDGLLSYIEVTTIDNLGNRNSSTEEFFTYDAQGRIYETDSTELQDYFGYEFGTFVPHFRFEYDDAGTIVKITVMYHDDIDALLTPTYDENGNLISTHIITNTGEYTVHFTYDSNGNRLSGERYDDWYETIETFTYTYDADGRLIQRGHNADTPWHYIITTDYFYDDAGHLAETCETWYQNGFNYDTWHIFTTFTYDADGKILSKTITSDEEDCSYAEQIVTYHYGA